MTAHACIPEGHNRLMARRAATFNVDPREHHAIEREAERAEAHA